MSKIKCPECGNMIDEKVVECPVCGTKIAENIVRCEHCGEVYFKDDGLCPNCHKPPKHNDKAGTNGGQSAPQKTQSEDTISTPAKEEKQLEDAQQEIESPAVNESVESTQENDNVEMIPAGESTKDVTQDVTPDDGDSEEEKTEKKPFRFKVVPMVVSAVIAAIIGSVSIYFYRDTKNMKEEQAYKLAMESADTIKLQHFLSQYSDAKAERKDSVSRRLQYLLLENSSWVSLQTQKTKERVSSYVRTYPDGAHIEEAKILLDSIDWAEAVATNAYRQYLTDHADGLHAVDARTRIYGSNLNEVVPEETALVRQTMTSFFDAINANDKEKFKKVFHTRILSFMGTESPTAGEVAAWLDRQYADGVQGMKWTLGEQSDISKKKSEISAYEYRVENSAVLELVKNGNTTSDKYKITARITPEGKICALAMVKHVPQEETAKTNSSGSEKPKQTSSGSSSGSSSSTKPSSASTKPAPVKQNTSTSKPASSNNKPSSSSTKPSTSTSKPSSSSSKPSTSTSKPATSTSKPSSSSSKQNTSSSTKPSSSTNKTGSKPSTSSTKSNTTSKPATTNKSNTSKPATTSNKNSTSKPSTNSNKSNTSKPATTSNKSGSSSNNSSSKKTTSSTSSSSKQSTNTSTKQSTSTTTKKSSTSSSSSANKNNSSKTTKK